ncbi:MAG TPA: tetratricopeptide repeat protein [Burkholderiaceae bacterium]|jgi:predicted negative regulator of RcsB-dependent stress response
MASQLDLEEQEQLEQLKAFWKQWGNLITWVVTIGLAAFAAWQGWNLWQRNQAAKAEGMFAAVQSAAQAGDLSKVDAVLKDLQGLSSTSFAAQGTLLAAKAEFDKGQLDAARANLNWVAANANQNEYRDVARLRLSGLQLDAKQYDEAAKTLDAVTGPEFAALVADRRGDLFTLQNKPAEAKAQYQKAYAAMDKTVEYRKLIESKLATLGVAAPDEEAAK